MKFVQKLIEEVKEIYEKYYKPLGYAWSGHPANADRLGIYAGSYKEVLYIELSIPQGFMSYSIELRDGGVRILQGCYSVYDESNVVMKRDYNSVDQLLNDLVKQAEALKPSIWLKVQKIGRYLNKNGRVKVEFADGQRYSLGAGSIVSMTYDKSEDLYYVGYKTDNVEFFKQRFPDAEKPAGELIYPLLSEMAVCKKCGRGQPSVTYDACWYCGNDDFKYVKELLLKDPSAKVITHNVLF